MIIIPLPKQKNYEQLENTHLEKKLFHSNKQRGIFPIKIRILLQFEGQMINFMRIWYDDYYRIELLFNSVFW